MKCLLLANGHALKPSLEFALTDVSWWTFAQKSLKCLILHPVSVGTLLSCTFCISIKLGWKQSLLFTEQILFSVKWWTITTITLPTISISSIKNAYTLHSESESPWVEPDSGIHDWWKVSDHTGVMVEGSLICSLLKDSEKVNHILWTVGTMSCSHSKEELSTITKKPLFISKRYYESIFWWIKYKWKQNIPAGDCTFLTKSWISMYSRYCQVQTHGESGSE